MKKVIEAEYIEKGRRGARGLVEFRQEFLPKSSEEVESAKYHYDWSEKMLYEEGSYAIEGFRESAKTTIVIDVYPLYAIFYPKEERAYIVLVKQNATLAKNKLKEIERGVEDNRWLRGKIIKVIEESGDAYEIEVSAPGEKGDKVKIRIEAYGKGASIRGLNWNGKRPSILIADDLQDEEDAKSQSVLESDWTWFRSEIGFLGKNTRFFMVANNLGERCIIERIGDDPKAFNFNFSRVPVIDERGESVWPEKFSKEFIKAEKQQYLKTGDIEIWMRNRMCVAVSPETQVFKRVDLRWYVAEERRNIIARSNIYISCDFAESLNKNACLRAFVVVGVDEEDYWYLIDARYGIWDAPEQLSILFELVRAYSPYKVGIECVGQHGALKYQTIVKAMTEERCIFSIAKITPSTKTTKNERIELALGQRIRINKLLLPEKAGWLEEVLTELLMFARSGPKSRYIDVIDALAQCAEFVKPPIGKETSISLSRKNLPRSSTGGFYIK